MNGSIKLSKIGNTGLEADEGERMLHFQHVLMIEIPPAPPQKWGGEGSCCKCI